MKKIHYILLGLIVTMVTTISVFGFRNTKIATNNLEVEHKKASSGYNYTLFFKNSLLMDVSLTRPSKNDNNILLCIPGAYTDLQTLKVDGLYIDKGKVYNKDKINHSLGGAIKIVQGDCEIFPSGKGKLLTDSLIDHIVNKKGSLFQQIQMIEKGKGATYKDTKLFQRRAIVKLKGNKTAMIESFEHVTLAAFTKDLLELGVIDALYTDMGSWDEGWYRDPVSGKITTIGRIRTETEKQCNWVVFKVK
ncbi:MAG: hypothetical protein J0L87_05415 [Bacteroidetes bacterium]|nr:hypothetical protein [Bacteroidota bacterium]